jgi:hypothetical protein
MRLMELLLQQTRHGRCAAALGDSCPGAGAGGTRLCVHKPVRPAVWTSAPDHEFPLARKDPDGGSRT